MYWAFHLYTRVTHLAVLLLYHFLKWHLFYLTPRSALSVKIILWVLNSHQFGSHAIFLFKDRFFFLPPTQCKAKLWKISLREQMEWLERNTRQCIFLLLYVTVTTKIHLPSFSKLPSCLKDDCSVKSNTPYKWSNGIYIKLKRKEEKSDLSFCIFWQMLQYLCWDDNLMWCCYIVGNTLFQPQTCALREHVNSN